MPSLAENIVASGTIPEALASAAQGVANGLARAIAVHDWVETLPEDDPQRIETVRPDVIHSYVYEKLEDGSTLVIYTTDKDMDGGQPLITLKAFPTLEAASGWSPRDEYAGWRHTTKVTAPTGDSTYTIGGGQ